MKLLTLLLTTLLTSCGLIPRKPETPVRTISSGPQVTDELIVLLPGRWSKPEEFADEGFTGIVRQLRPRARVIAPDLHLGYYYKQLAPKRLHEDVIAPAKKAGVRKITLVGISMGGLGALIYDLGYPDMIDEMILLSPFAGEPEVIEEISKAGGLAKWTAPEELAPKDFSRRLWAGLKEKWMNGQPRLILGCGDKDRLAPTSRLVAKEFLSRNDQVWVEGGHDWPTWNQLIGKTMRAAD